MYYNSTDYVGQVVNGLTQYITGSMLITFFLILLFIVMIGIVLRLNVTTIMIFTFPLVIGMTAFVPSFRPIGLIVLIFFGVFIAKDLLTQR